MCGFATLIYIHRSDNKLITDYRRSMQKQINLILEKAHLPADTDIQALIDTLKDPKIPQNTENVENTSETLMPASVPIQTHLETDTLSDVVLPPNFKRVTSPPNAKKLPKMGNNSEEVVFPSASNCNKKEHNLMIKNHKGPTVPTRDIYPCKKWRAINPNNQLWPVVVEPTKGKILNSININNINNEVHDLVKEQLAVQQERLKRLSDTCNKYPDIAIRQHVTFVWDTAVEPPVVYCPLYKVASTTWMVYFLRLAHINDDNPALDIYNKSGQEKKKYMPRFGGGHRRVFQEFKAPSTPSERNKIFKKSLRFIVVRHPFLRLLSAYRDKIERPKPRPFAPYFKDLQRAIILKYRPVGSNANSPTPTFSEFVDYVIDSTEHLKTAKEWEENVVCWTPYWSQCGVCSTDYQIVIKLETMADDEQFLAHIADLKEIQNVHEWRNLKRASVTSSTVQPKYYGTLTKRQIRLLYERYKVDFELFGYTIDEYLLSAKD